MSEEIYPDPVRISRDLLRVLLKKKKRELTALPAGIAALSLAAVLISGPVYESRAVLFLKPAVSLSGEADYSSQQANARMVGNILSIALQDAVLDRVCEETGTEDADSLRHILTVGSEGDTELITVTARTKDPRYSADCAQKCAEALVLYMNETLRVRNISVVSEAAVSDRRIFPDAEKTAAWTLCACLAADLCLILLYCLRERGLHDAAEAEELARVPVFSCREEEFRAYCRILLRRIVIVMPEKDLLKRLGDACPGVKEYGSFSASDCPDVILVVSEQLDRREVKNCLQGLRIGGVKVRGMVLIGKEAEG